jgi:hypothetical protein
MAVHLCGWLPGGLVQSGPECLPSILALHPALIGYWPGSSANRLQASKAEYSPVSPSISGVPSASRSFSEKNSFDSFGCRIQPRRPKCGAGWTGRQPVGTSRWLSIVVLRFLTDVRRAVGPFAGRNGVWCVFAGGWVRNGGCLHGAVAHKHGHWHRIRVDTIRER